MALAPADLDPIKLWTIGALTKIVESPSMLTAAEKFQFKNDFLNWLISNYTCLEQKFFMKKMSLLFASLFAQLGSSSKIKKSERWGNAYQEYIDLVFNQANFPAINNTE